MNTNTKDKLIQLTDEINKLATALLIYVGPETASNLTSACYDVKYALEHDETIKEPR